MKSPNLPLSIHPLWLLIGDLFLPLLHGLALDATSDTIDRFVRGEMDRQRITGRRVAVMKHGRI